MIRAAIAAVVVLAGTTSLAVGSPMSAGAAVRNATTIQPADAPKTPKLNASGCSSAEALFNRHSGKVMEVYHSATADGAEVDQWAYNGTATQHWIFCEVTTWQNNPVYTIKNSNSGKCLDVQHDVMGDGTYVQQWDCNGGAAQDWLWFNYGPYDTLAPYNTANSDVGFLYVLEVNGANVNNGGVVDIWAGNAQANTEWCPGAACS